MKLYCDNKSAINPVQNSVQQDHTKHVEVDKHFTKEKLEADMISMTYFNS